MTERSLSGGQARTVIFRLPGLAAALLALAACGPTAATDAPAGKPKLHLLTSLPLLWGETFGLDQPKSQAMAKLEERFEVTPVDLPGQLPEGGLLLAAQPRALPAEELVALDAWVRQIGRAHV